MLNEPPRKEFPPRGLLTKSREKWLTARLCLVSLDQVADALRIRLAVPVAGNGVGPTGRFNHDLRPEHAGGNMHRSDLRNGNALFVAAEQAALHAGDTLRADDEPGRKQEVPLRPAAGRSEICTEAIFEMEMLSSLLPNRRPFTRATRCGLMTSRVGNRKFPCVQRLAVNVSAGEESIGLSRVAVMQFA